MSDKKIASFSVCTTSIGFVVEPAGTIANRNESESDFSFLLKLKAVKGKAINFLNVSH